MKDISLFNKSFNVQKSSTYGISVQLGLDGYTFTIVDAIRKRFNAVKHVNFSQRYAKTDNRYFDNVVSYFAKDAFLSKSYKTVNFIYNFPEFIIIPENYFIKEDLKRTFLLHYNLSDEEELQFNYVKELKSYIVFSVSSDLTNFLVNKFPQVEFYHQVSIWAKMLKKMSVDTEFTAIYFNYSFFNIAVFNNQKELLYLQSVPYSSKKDVVYHIITILEELGKEPVKQNLFFAGDIDEKDELYGILTQFFPYISFLTITDKTSLIYLFDEVPEYKLMSLLSY